MEKLTAEQIIERAKEIYKDDFHEFASDPSSEIAGPVTQVNSTGGMDKGSDWSRTYRFEDHDVYLKVKGFYASHDGVYFDNTWDSIKEVRPKQVTITVYE